MTQQPKEERIDKVSPVFTQTLHHIVFAYHFSCQYIKDTLQPYGITPQQYNVLKILRTQYPSPSTINLIKSRIIDQMSDASRIVDRLIFKGYLEKKTNPYDKRAVAIIITEKGLSLLKKVDRETDLSSVVSTYLTEEEALQLNSLLTKMRR